MRPAGGLTGMADKGGRRELPQRFRGDTRAATSPSGSPAVVSAGGEVTTPSIRGGNGLGGTSLLDPRGGGQAGSADTAQKRTRAASAGPLTEDEVTEWIGTADRSQEAAPGVAPEAEPESASWLGAGLAALIVIPALVIGSLAVVAVRHFTGTGSLSAAAAGQEAATRHEAAVRGQAAA